MRRTACRLAVSVANPNDVESVGVYNTDSPQPTSYRMDIGLWSMC